MKSGLIKILDGNTFLISDDRGDLDSSISAEHGLFSFDTRFLSRWQLTVNGERMQAMAVDDSKYFETRLLLVPGARTHYVEAKVSVVRERYVGRSMAERLTVFNYDDEAIDFTIRLEVGSDFADAVEIIALREQGDGARVGQHYAEVEEKSLRLGYRRKNFRRETIVSTSAPARIDEHGLTYSVRVEPNGQWIADLHVDAVVIGPHERDFRQSVQGFHSRKKAEIEQDLDQWLARMPQLSCDWAPMSTTYRRSLVDLAALRHSPMTFPTGYLPAGGVPWSMTIVGRESLLTSLQVLPFAPEFAVTTLRVLGALQGTRLDDFRDEEPGKIMREFRYGETSAFEERPHSPYYGSADTTPLFVILLDEYERWTGDAALVRLLECEARAALDWIDSYGNVMEDGYLWYLSRNETTGLVNQSWKESREAISYRDGRLPGLPRATCELQGYAYDAKLRGARLARQFWSDPGLADRLERDAADLRQRFNRDFWIADGEYYALALDADGGQVDALASNMGHLLWSGIVDQSRAGKVAQHLLGPRLYSGWGVRTLAVGEARYNPIGHQVGTVWPFDNSFIAWGLTRYNRQPEAARIAEGLLDAAQFFDGRLPEAFGGYERRLTKYPVPYPAASSPQAYSTGAPLLLLRTMLGLEPYGDRLTVNPVLPPKIGWLGLLDVRGRWGRTDVCGHGREAAPTTAA
ncbi:Glycogen debranching enzyme (alpha-1,6-glucosidase) [Micromonospora rhizosphaerae]|uniref:Glycogen debranching enzyme (Alpha-1,6-glucosidase) n=1 Tax=Micromonospora rhizosphaerae TaxID=568872 RepID=A0A1C6RLS9_9ACTN|nr:glycogen debranching N-terminal domain-containing protein [Micromonospora rhizosphaerae]SCL18110.1 Glycogen debranching enzyme (alpha-1,6-glucosidase) [Micromonospora rhizosphaerae]